MLIGAIVALSLGFLVCQIIDVLRDAWRRREYRRALEIVQARNARLLPPPADPLPRGEYRAVVIHSRRGGKSEAARLEALRFPDHPIIPTRDAHFGE